MFKFGQKAKESPIQPVERFVERPFKPLLLEADEATIQTLADFEAEPQVDIYLDLNRETGYTVINSDGSTGWIAECVNINGVQFPIPANQRVKVPRSVYEFLMACPHQKDFVRFYGVTMPLSMTPGSVKVRSM